MQHDAILTGIRPKLNLPTDNSTPLEQFQNTTLRPILKMLHDPLAARLVRYFEKRKTDFTALQPVQQQALIGQSIRNDHYFRHSLAGMVIGHFTHPELDFFLKNEAAVMRRISDLIVQRLQSTVLIPVVKI